MNTNDPFFQSISLSDVVLRVRQLESALAFYHGVLGFQIVTQEAERVELSANGRTPSLITLELAPDAPSRPAGSSGLFHTAVLYPHRGALGRIARKLLAEGIRFATGDHGVSEALYLDDPEGNGVELYADRPVAVWPKAATAADRVGMHTEAVDLVTLVQAGQEENGPLLPSDTRIGHIHLNVADLVASEWFYHELLGLDVMVRSLPGALFLGRDGYHHHFGTNVWRSRAPAVPGALGLSRFTLRFASPEEFARLSKVFAKDRPAGSSEAIVIHDPSGIEMAISPQFA